MTITLDETQQEVVAAESDFYASRVRDAETSAAFRDLSKAAASGELQDTQGDPLGSLLSLGLASGRIRALYGAHAELAAGKLFRHTPQGKALREEAQEATDALRVLRDNEIRDLRISARGPGLYSLTLETAGCRIVINLGPTGIDVRSVEVAV